MAAAALSPKRSAQSQIRQEVFSHQSEMKRIDSPVTSTQYDEGSDWGFKDVQSEINVSRQLENSSKHYSNSGKFKLRTTEPIKTCENNRFEQDLRTWLSTRLEGRIISSISENAEDLTNVFTG